MPVIKQRRGRRRPNLKRASSPKGIAQRAALRLAAYKPEVPKGGSGTQHHNRPGSMNRRKVGR
jgi:hypothetical protein